MSRQQSLRADNQPVKSSVNKDEPTLKSLPHINPVVAWAFYSFIFSLPFEMGRGRLLPFEIPTLLGSLFLLAALLQPRICFRRPPRTFWCFALYLVVFIISLISHDLDYPEIALTRLIWLVQLIFLLWISSNLMRYHRVAKASLVALVASCAILAILQLSGVFSRLPDLYPDSRASVMGQNPSNLAGILSMGVLALIGLLYARKGSALRFRFLAWPLFLLIGNLVVSTGSRGPLLALGLGLLVFALGRGGIWVRCRNALITILGIGFLVWFSFQLEGTRHRFQEAVEVGNLAGREEIFPTAWQMFLEKPLFGWGPVSKNFEIERRVLHPNFQQRDPHNLVLEVLTGTGILGAIPFIAGIWLSMRTAWKARGGSVGILPFSMSVAALMINMSLNWMYSKTYWLVLAFALASSSSLVRSRYRSAVTAIAWRARVLKPQHARAV